MQTYKLQSNWSFESSFEKHDKNKQKQSKNLGIIIIIWRSYGVWSENITVILSTFDHD